MRTQNITCPHCRDMHQPRINTTSGKSLFDTRGKLSKYSDYGTGCTTRIYAFDSQTTKRICFATASRSAVSSIQRNLQRVPNYFPRINCSKREAEPDFSSTKIKYAWSYTSTTLYLFIAWKLSAGTPFEFLLLKGVSRYLKSWYPLTGSVWIAMISKDYFLYKKFEDSLDYSICLKSRDISKDIWKRVSWSITIIP